MNESGWMSWAPALQSLEIVMRLLLAGALLFILWEVMILLASLISPSATRTVTASRFLGSEISGDIKEEYHEQLAEAHRQWLLRRLATVCGAGGLQ